MKHYVGYGAAEGGRDYNSTWIPEVLLRDVCLPPLPGCAGSRRGHAHDGFQFAERRSGHGRYLYPAQDPPRGVEIQRMVVSDYEAVTQMVPHGYAANTRDAARAAVRAGIDMEMVSTAYQDHLRTLVASGQVPMDIVDAAVRNILRLKLSLGLFDERSFEPVTVQVTPESRALAQRLATESMVLLKNQDRVLPLSESSRPVAVIGPLADSPTDQMGTWVMDGRPQDVVTPLAAVRQTLGESRVLYAAGLRNSRDMNTGGFAAAVAAARNAGVVLLFLGEEQILSGEARSRAFLNLPGAQEELVNEIAKGGKPMVAVIMAGRPLTFHDTASKVKAVLWAWHPGTMGGPAIADLLFGRAVPSGKLNVTFPRTVGQVPLYYAHLSTGRPPLASELGIPMGNPEEPRGYTSRYLDVDFTPEYPFGYGLSYTQFDYANLRVSSPSLRRDGRLMVSADVANRGGREAAEVVQLYVHAVAASVIQPVRLLKGFQRVMLKPGEKRRVEFTIAASDLAFHNQQMQLVTEPGRYQVWIAPDSASGLQGEFVVE